MILTPNSILINILNQIFHVRLFENHELSYTLWKKYKKD